MAVKPEVWKEERLRKARKDGEPVPREWDRLSPQRATMAALIRSSW
jgi:hypothetical protein